MKPVKVEDTKRFAMPKDHAQERLEAACARCRLDLPNERIDEEVLPGWYAVWEDDQIVAYVKREGAALHAHNHAVNRVIAKLLDAGW